MLDGHLRNLARVAAAHRLVPPRRGPLDKGQDVRVDPLGLVLGVYPGAGVVRPLPGDDHVDRLLCLELVLREGRQPRRPVLVGVGGEVGEAHDGRRVRHDELHEPVEPALARRLPAVQLLLALHAAVQQARRLLVTARSVVDAVLDHLADALGRVAARLELRRDGVRHRRLAGAGPAEHVHVHGSRCAALRAHRSILIPL